MCLRKAEKWTSVSPWLWADVSEEVEEDPTGGKNVLSNGKLNGAPHKAGAFTGPLFSSS
jgi:hypothetical protein